MEFCHIKDLPVQTTTDCKPQQQHISNVNK